MCFLKSSLQILGMLGLRVGAEQSEGGVRDQDADDDFEATSKSEYASRKGGSHAAVFLHRVVWTEKRLNL